VENQAMGEIGVGVARRLAGLATAAVVVGTLVVAVASSVAAGGAILGTANPNTIKDSYLVIFKDSIFKDGVFKDRVFKDRVFKDGAAVRTESLVARLAAAHGARVTQVYRHALHGFAATMSETAARQLVADPAVAYVEQDSAVSIADTQFYPPSWGLDRIDQPDLPLNSSYTYPNTASTVRAYILDSGIRLTHATFGRRAAWGVNTTGDNNNTDCNGHGTHVAGTVGGSTYGVAKGVQLIAVKVLNCLGNGSAATVTAGIDWVTGDHPAGVPAVANVSLGIKGSNITAETALRNSIAGGVVYAVAAGNFNADACNYTPARVAEAITVNASDDDDVRASFSNFGTCTDIFAPGVNITSAWHTSDTATKSISGTSMATPHVTGGAALILGANPEFTPAQVAARMFSDAVTNRIINPGGGTPNRLLSVGTGGPPPPGCAPVMNGTDTPIPDMSTVESTITISGCTGNASASSTVQVHISHTWSGDLIVALIAPDGSQYNLYNRSGGSSDNIDQMFTRDLSSELANGVWRLRVQDVSPPDIGLIDSWTLDL
jgi:subtilisin family serine protease